MKQLEELLYKNGLMNKVVFKMHIVKVKVKDVYCRKHGVKLATFQEERMIMMHTFIHSNN